MTVRTASSRLRAVVARGDPRTDAELLHRFVIQHDHSAFAALVGRHGPLVYGVCRRTLGATADADDAFQATFLVLAQKAGAVPWRANLGPWLFGVSHRIARKARFKRDRRFAVEKQVDAMPHPHATTPDPAESDELSRAFDEELAGLPEDMRRAVVLCELQGRSRQQAAKELRISEGTLSSRLARARKLLRDRLAKRGFGLAIPGAVVVSTKLTAATVGLAQVLATETAGVVPAAVWALSQEAMKAMTISKLKLGAVLAAVAVGFTGFGLTAFGGDEVKPPPKADAPVKPAVEPPKTEEPKKRLELSISLKSGSDAVASIDGQDVSRAEFAEHLIRKYGAKEIEAFVNLKIIEAEAKKRGVMVTAEEVEAGFQADCKSLNLTSANFANQVLSKYGKTEADWREEVLRPRLQMEKVLRSDVKVTEDDLKKLFERKYGEKRVVRITGMGHRVDDEGDLSKAVAGDVRATPPSRSEYPPDTVTQHAWPIPRYMSDLDDQPIADAVFGLSKAGDTAENVMNRKATRSYTLVLVEIVPPQKDKKFEDERAALLAEATKEKLGQSIPKHFAKLKEQAKPVYHIRPEMKK